MANLLAFNDFCSYSNLYDNQINTCALIGQSAMMVYCTSKGYACALIGQSAMMVYCTSKRYACALIGQSAMMVYCKRMEKSCKSNRPQVSVSSLEA